MLIAGIDPGPRESALIVLDTDGVCLAAQHYLDNAVLADRLGSVGLPGIAALVIERIAASGMSVSQDTFDTCWWSGRFAQAWDDDETCHMVKRREVRMILGNRASMKESELNAHVRGLFEPSGGGARPQIGTKAAPGPLFGIRSHGWAALAVACAWAIRHGHMKG